MSKRGSAGDLLITTLRDVCKATAQLEKLDNERFMTQQALERARALYDQLMEETPSALLLLDQEGHILASNHQSEALLGFRQEELVSMNVQQLYHEDASHEFRPAFQQVLKEGSGTIQGLSSVGKGGQGVLVDSLFIVVTYEEKTFVQVTLKPATERYKLQLAEKRYLQGLELLSRTATGLLEASHDDHVYRLLGNYIGKLVGDAYVIINSFDKKLNLFFVKDIAGPIRNAEIILGLLLRHLVGASFPLTEEEFKRYVMSCTPVAVPGGLRGLFEDRLPKDVYRAMEEFFLFGSTYIAGLTSEREVFGMVTILMPRGAKLDHPALVATLMQQASAVLRYRGGEAEPIPEQPLPSLESLHHVAPEELPYSLEPYAGEKENNTKQESQIEAAGAPSLEGNGRKNRELRHLLADSKILVVDDEEIVRDVTGGMLSYMGCEVGYARNGLEALARYKSALDTGVPFDAVILDLSLSGSPNAAETIRNFKQIHAGVRIVASAVSSNDPALKQFEQSDFHTLVVRPYKSTELAEALRKALDNRVRLA
ncbi:MAG TPA: PAS domain S-box protein [Syntrophorhabdales bacterium]|nr:PAS domain S-box protein [Syntrophorhabdales bacterium]